MGGGVAATSSRGDLLLKRVHYPPDESVRSYTEEGEKAGRSRALSRHDLQHFLLGRIRAPEVTTLAANHCGIWRRLTETAVTAAGNQPMVVPSHIVVHALYCYKVAQGLTLYAATKVAVGLSPCAGQGLRQRSERTILGSAISVGWPTSTSTCSPDNI